jgi:hypothetical protein
VESASATPLRIVDAFSRNKVIAGSFEEIVWWKLNFLVLGSGNDGHIPAVICRSVIFREKLKLIFRIFLKNQKKFDGHFAQSQGSGAQQHRVCGVTISSTVPHTPQALGTRLTIE